MEMMDRPVGNPYLICWRKYITRENDDLDSDDMQYLVRKLHNKVVNQT